MENKQSLFELREKLSHLNINEVDTDHAAYIPESKVDKIFNSIVKIKVCNRCGTGFFMKLKIQKIMLYFLVTCHHVILEKDVDSKETIGISYGKINEEIKKEIKLNKRERFIKCFNKPVDITLIEIILEDSIPDNKFLELDGSYNDIFGFRPPDFKDYLEKDIYLAGYPADNNVNGERVVCSGKITEIKNFEFSHSLDSKSGSSGSPICLINNTKVIGIHKSGIKEYKINFGTFIGFIVKVLQEKIKIILSPRYVDNPQSKDYHLHQFQQIQIPEKIKCLDTLGKLLSIADIYAFRINKKNLKVKLFEYYEYDNYNNYSKIQLFKALKKELELFKAEYLEYCIKYKRPEIPREFIICHLHFLRSILIDSDDKRIFDNIINILNENKI